LLAEPGNTWKADYPGRMTVEELEALQFIAVEKARQVKCSLFS
jgi:hypothetical protein